MMAGAKAAWVAVQAFTAGVPPWAWRALAIIAAVVAVWWWHSSTVDKAREAGRKAGAQAQAEADARAYTEAAIAAADAQQAIITSLKTKQTGINERTTNALEKRHADLARNYDDLRLRWAAYRADQGSAGRGEAAAVPRTAASFDAAACAAEGWVSLDVAATAAEAADRAIAKDDAWIAWVNEARAAWPR
jgi:type II secretory pathway pseudopilin PulG